MGRLRSPRERDETGGGGTFGGGRQAAKEPMKGVPTKSMKRIALVTAMLVSTGCYRYTPVEPRAVAPGESVRLVVTREGSRELLEVVDDDRAAPFIEGSVDRWDDADLVLRVSLPRRPEGLASRDLRQMIRVPTGEIVSMERRETDAFATGALLAGAVAGSTALVLLIMEAWGQGPDGPGDDPVLFFSVPIG